jgi:RNA polymerase-binding transcription factor DksA
VVAGNAVGDQKLMTLSSATRLMDGDRREGFKGRLQRQRAALLSQLAAATSLNGSLATRRELGTPQAPCDRSGSTPTDSRTCRTLEEIDAGLARLAADSYGICTMCGHEIALRRLELVPATPYCLRCARRRSRAPHGVKRFAATLGKLLRR